MSSCPTTPYTGAMQIKQEEEDIPAASPTFARPGLAAPGHDPLGVEVSRDVAGEGSKKPKRERTAFTYYQLRVLEELFRVTGHPDSFAKKEVALKTNLPESKITVWFKNRRAKHRIRNQWKSQSRPGSSTPSRSQVSFQCVDTSPLAGIKTEVGEAVTNNSRDFDNSFSDGYNTDENSRNSFVDVSNCMEMEMDIGEDPIFNPCEITEHKVSEELQSLIMSTCPKQRDRTSFTKEQLEVLDALFQETEYPDLLARKKVALSLNLPESKVTVWFQNRRARDRNQGKVQSPSQISQPQSSPPGNSHEQFPQLAIKSEIEIEEDLKVNLEDLNNSFLDKENDDENSGNDSIDEKMKSIMFIKEKIEMIEDSDTSHSPKDKPDSGPKHKVSEDLKSAIISSNPQYNINFTYSQRMNTQMVVSGYLLNKKRGPYVSASSGLRSISWKCAVFGCPYHACTLEGTLTDNGLSVHNHEKQPEIFAKKEARHMLIKKIAEGAATSEIPIPFVLETFTQDIQPNILGKLGSLDALRQAANRMKKKLKQKGEVVEAVFVDPSNEPAQLSLCNNCADGNVARCDDSDCITRNNENPLEIGKAVKTEPEPEFT
eukprot:GFUD01000170.1.p1 GENE.GFUD01000170.1~~GFUD01000170.1.p1  ORF type:complete len:600 (-),score=151.76 GFUD01000170.1:226-2025(-)